MNKKIYLVSFLFVPSTQLYSSESNILQNPISREEQWIRSRFAPQPLLEIDAEETDLCMLCQERFDSFHLQRLPNCNCTKTDGTPQPPIIHNHCYFSLMMSKKPFQCPQCRKDNVHFPTPTYWQKIKPFLHFMLPGILVVGSEYTHKEALLLAAAGTSITLAQEGLLFPFPSHWYEDLRNLTVTTSALCFAHCYGKLLLEKMPLPSCPVVKLAAAGLLLHAGHVTHSYLTKTYRHNLLSVPKKSLDRADTIDFLEAYLAEIGD